MRKLNAFHIYYAKVRFFDNEKLYKYRPVIVLTRSNHTVMCFKITSQYHFKSRFIKNNFCGLPHWKRENLTKKSYVDLNKTITLDIRDIKDHVGYLCNYDLKKMLDFATERFATMPNHDLSKEV